MAAGGMPEGRSRQREPDGMAGSGETYPAACGRTEPALAGVCAFGKDSDADSGVPLGTGTETDTVPAVAAGAAV